MAKQNRQRVSAARKESKQVTGRVIKEKFVPERTFKAQSIEAKNQNQKLMLRSINENIITIGRGSAGTGKTYLAASQASNMLLNGDINRIVLLRPYVPMGRTTGFWPGTIEERLEPWLAPMLSVIKERIGEKQYQNDIGKRIIMQPMEAVRGMSFKDTFVIIDESQNINREEARSLVTRIGENTKLVLIGDDSQADLDEHESGLNYLIQTVKRARIEDVGVIEFTADDIVRSDIVGKFVRAFEKEGRLR